MSEVYIAIAILGLAVIAVAFLLSRRMKRQPLSLLTVLSLALIVSGVAFSDDRAIAYSLMGVGVVVAIIDALVKQRSGLRR